MHRSRLTSQLKEEAHRQGFDLVGVCPAVPPPGIDRFRQWLAAGYAGQMRYLADRAGAYEHPKHVLEGAKSVVMLAMNYRTAEPARPSPGEAKVSRYAWGAADYHDVVRARLRALGRLLQERAPGAAVRGVVDTAPLLERELAQLAGLGWIGKNTMLLNHEVGSWFFLAALLTDLELDYDTPFPSDHCGSCRACLDACPTGAFPRPYVLDATKCISYLTIELRGSIPGRLRAEVGDWLFGCDLCQEVCPWNRRGPASHVPAFAPRDDMNPIELASLFELDDEAFRRRFGQTPLWRSRRRGILRNAAIVLGNHPVDRALRGLIRGLNDREPLVRAACAWALGRYQHDQARRALQQRLGVESDDEARREIAAALRVKAEGEPAG